MHNDLINGCFELFGGLLFIINIVKLIKDKKINGVSWVPTMFFTLWGAWNLHYYPSLGQMYSFWGGVIIFIVNFIWLILVFYYKFKEKNNYGKKNIC
jgi:hypothetical protein